MKHIPWKSEEEDDKYEDDDAIRGKSLFELLYHEEKFENRVY